MNSFATIKKDGKGPIGNKTLNTEVSNTLAEAISKIPITFFKVHPRQVDLNKVYYTIVELAHPRPVNHGFYQNFL